MLTKTTVINAPTGLHARPAGELVKLIKESAPSAVSITASGRKVNAASMLSLLSLGLKKGTQIEVSVDGGDEAAVLARVIAFLDAVKD